MSKCTNHCHNLALEPPTMSTENPSPPKDPSTPKNPFIPENSSTSKFTVHQYPTSNRGKLPKRWYVEAEKHQSFYFPRREGYLEDDAVDAISTALLSTLKMMNNFNKRHIELQGYDKVQRLFSVQIKKLKRSTQMWEWLKREGWEVDENKLSVYWAFMTPFPEITPEEEDEVYAVTAAKQKKVKEEPRKGGKSYVDLSKGKDRTTDQDQGMF
jgi:hypothetical protein